MSEPVTHDEHLAAAAAFNAAPDTTTKVDLRELVSRAVEDVRIRSGPWSVYAQSWDLPGRGHVVSTHDSEAAALTECRRLNAESQSDAGGYGIHPTAPERTGEQR